MFDPSGLTNTTGNAGRGYQGAATPLNFSSLSNLFGGGQGAGGGTGHAPMNVMPQNADLQPGMNLPGFMRMLGGAFGGGSNFQANMGASWRASPLGRMFQPGAQSAPTPEFGANIPQYLTQQILDRQRGGGSR
jgi:hypothetical protein